MKILYLGMDGSYSYITSIMIAEKLGFDKKIIEGKPNFTQIWEQIKRKNIAVLPIENSYAGSVHENMYNFLRYDVTIVGEYVLPLDHCLASKEDHIRKVTRVYSHPQALTHCYNFLHKNKIHPIHYSDTAAAAKFVADSNDEGIGAICSKYTAELYGLNILAENIQDQEGNKTRFFVVVPQGMSLNYPDKANKVTIVFEARDIPSSLYKCLGGFSTNNVNLTKIESLPSLKDPFTYMFWLDFNGTLEDDAVKKSFDELNFFTNSIKILGEY